MPGMRIQTALAPSMKAARPVLLVAASAPSDNTNMAGHAGRLGNTVVAWVGKYAAFCQSTASGC